MITKGGGANRCDESAKISAKFPFLLPYIENNKFLLFVFVWDFFFPPFSFFFPRELVLCRIKLKGHYSRTKVIFALSSEATSKQSMC